MKNIKTKITATSVKNAKDMYNDKKVKIVKAIEAARAEKHRKGFAVVADEV